MQPNKILLPRDGHARTWTVRSRRKLWKVPCQPQQQRGSETKKNVCVCVCARAVLIRISKDADSWGHEAPAIPALHWPRCCQATRQPIRAGRGVPLSAVTSPGTLNGEPQSLNALMRRGESRGKTYMRTNKRFHTCLALKKFVTMTPSGTF